MKDAHVIGIIPARWGSTRFPGKALHPIAGKPLVQHVWDRCLRCQHLADLAIATDDDRIREAAEAFGARICMTSDQHPTGTDRLAEAIEAFPDATHAINIQGDEPLIDPALVDQLAVTLGEEPGLPMITAAHALDKSEEQNDPNIVKVVLDLKGDALYFSRSRIPYARQPGGPVYRHLGLYGYARDFLSRYLSWPPAPLERSEQLEQLRALENGARIRVIITDTPAIGVDTPEQAVQVENIILNNKAT